MNAYTGPDAEFEHPDDWRQALADRPWDAGLRLVYADWLDEQGMGQRAARQRQIARWKFPKAPIHAVWPNPIGRPVLSRICRVMAQDAKSLGAYLGMIAVDLDGRVLDGEHRLKAMRILDRKRAIVVFHDRTEWVGDGVPR